nr:hypothetical protein [Parachlamydiaceae bacterium]
MNALYLLIFILTASLTASESWNTSRSPGFSASATISKQEIFLPEAFIIELMFNSPAAYHIDEKVLLANLLRNPRPGAAPFLILSVEKQSLPSQEGEKAEKWTFHLEPQLAGKYGLTFLNIVFLSNASGEKPVELISGILEINVILTESKDHSFLPIETPLKLSRTFPIDLNPKLRATLQQKMADQEPTRNRLSWAGKRFPWEIVCVLLALLGTALYYKFAPRKKLVGQTILDSQMHYHAANEKLSILQQQAEINPSIAESYIVELSNAVRSEIEEKYHLNILPDTTEEFFAQLKSAALLDSDKLAKLKEFTKLADKVKFASHIPTLE